MIGSLPYFGPAHLIAGDWDSEIGNDRLDDVAREKRGPGANSRTRRRSARTKAAGNAGIAPAATILLPSDSLGQFAKQLPTSVSCQKRGVLYPRRGPLSLPPTFPHSFLLTKKGTFRNHDRLVSEHSGPIKGPATRLLPLIDTDSGTTRREAGEIQGLPKMGAQWSKALGEFPRRDSIDASLPRLSPGCLSSVVRADAAEPLRRHVLVVSPGTTAQVTCLPCGTLVRRAGIHIWVFARIACPRRSTLLLASRRCLLSVPGMLPNRLELPSLIPIASFPPTASTAPSCRQDFREQGDEDPDARVGCGRQDE